VQRAASILSNALRWEIVPAIEVEIGLSPTYRGNLMAFDKRLSMKWRYPLGAVQQNRLSAGTQISFLWMFSRLIETPKCVLRINCNHRL
jgi:hypothetical protein